MVCKPRVGGPGALNEVKNLSVVQWQDGYTDYGSTGDFCHLMVLEHFTVEISVQSVLFRKCITLTGFDPQLQICKNGGTFSWGFKKT